MQPRQLSLFPEAGEILVPSMRVHCLRESYDVYIGRENRHYCLSESPWANPVPFGDKHKRTRAEAIEEYRTWILTQPELLAQLPTLYGKVLGCWCAPEDCHGRVLIELCADRVGDWH